MATPILYDLAGKGHNSCWNPNAWKTRLVLNYKGIDYKTTWVEYPDIAPTMKSFGIEANETGPGAPFAHTIPAMRFPDGTYVMDSAKIAVKIEALWANNPLHLDSPLVPEVEKAIFKVMMPLIPVFVPSVSSVLSEKSIAYFEESRSKLFGPLDQLAKEKGGDPAWANAKEGIDEMATLLKAQGGPFFLGREVSYADFHVVGLLLGLKRTNQNGFERFMSFDPAYGKLFKECEPWMARDD